MLLTIPKRQIDFDPNLTFKPRTVGEDHYVRLAVAVRGAVLAAEEFNQLMLDDAAYKHFYKQPKESDPVPRFDTFSFIPLNSFDQAQVQLSVARRILKIKDANIVKNRILLLPGNPIWQFTIQALFAKIDEAAVDLIMRIGDKGQMELNCETYGAQPQLPIEVDDEDEDPEEDDEDEAVELSSTGKKIAAAAARKEPKTE